ncbi:uncharacterized protein TNCV_3543251 [Trichonephila clavipes]|nr:uncharacterized protein TNCV_3543251 [Trichonephila clavipes]
MSRYRSLSSITFQMATDFHTARDLFNRFIQKRSLGDRIIRQTGPVNWPPRSCDLKLDYFLWGYVKSLVYADKPRRNHLEENIRRVLPIYGHKCSKNH